ncbi:MAG: DUF294 nucleotidyltransferase-like domain-containing protein [Bacteroidia bacterium]
MLAHSLVTRTADFLRQYPPFTYLPREELDALALQVKIRFFTTDDIVFRQGDPFGEVVYVLHKGRVEVIQETDGSAFPIDMCEVGDMFGVKTMLSRQPYLATAQAREDTLLYTIPSEVFIPLMERYPKVAVFFASGYAAGMTIIRAAGQDLQSARRVLLQEPRTNLLFREEDIIAVKHKEDVVFCTARNTVQEAAQIMTEYKVGALVVANERLEPIGILTDTDMTRKVAAGRVQTADTVDKLMSTPVRTVPPGETVAEAMLTMMRFNIRHLVVTEDGTASSRFVGIFSEHDMLLAQGNNPAVLAKLIRKARNVAELADIRNRAEALFHAYLRQEISVEFITGTATEINDALIRRAIELSQKQLEAEGLRAPEVPFCWMSLGSEGRGEQLLRTDQDNALIYEDPPTGREAAARDYYLRLGKAVTDILEACGFAHCPGEIMASNPKWNGPLHQWKEHFAGWIRLPEPKALMHGTIFFDFRPAYGDTRLTDALTAFLFGEMREEKGFINFFAQNALGNPPPLSFFKQFIVERGGKHKDEFDIKLRGMMPLADAARVLLLHQEVGGIANTVARYRELAAREPHNRALYDEAAMAYEMLIRHRALNGFERGNSGRYLRPEDLNKIERQTLKYAFRTIEELQSIIRTRFSLTFFGS